MLSSQNPSEFSNYMSVVSGTEAFEGAVTPGSVFVITACIGRSIILDVFADNADRDVTEQEMGTSWM